MEVSRPKIRLSRLRDIGWKHWDPVGLLKAGQNWENFSFANEYDGYLLRTAGMVRRNAPTEEAIEYLLTIERDHMGLGDSTSAQKRAEATVAAIAADEELWNCP